MRYMTLFSFRKYNPTWEMILYISDNDNEKNWKGIEEQDFSNYKGIDYFEKVKELNIEVKKIKLPDEIQNKIKKLSPVHESDIFRYYELYTNGGIYSDMDVLYFRSIDDLYNSLEEKNIDTLIHQDTGYITIGFLGSGVENKLFSDIFNKAINLISYNNYQSFGVDLIYSMFGGNRQNPLIIDKIKKIYQYLNIFNLKNQTVYQFDWTMINYNFNNAVGINSFSKDSIGYHWFGGSPISQKFNNLLNGSNYQNYKITFSEICKEILK
jgi:mannosyltransferase OCH1-like enzyme